MYEVVDDEKSAVKLQYKANKMDVERVFCPLINKQCNPECVCFIKATYHKDARDKYIVQNGHCDNNMFHGE